MENFAKLLEAVASLLWPTLAIIVVWFSREPLKAVVKSWAWRKSTFKVGDIEISVDDYNQQQRDIIGDLQDKIINLEKRIADTSYPNDVEEKSRRKIGNILWVDDHPENHIQLIEQLNNKEISVIQEKSTNDALERLSTSKFDLIITDMHRIEYGVVHGEAGMELIRSVREQESNVPIVLFFGRSRKPVQRYRDVATQAGATLVTSSPTELMTLIELSGKGVENG